MVPLGRLRMPALIFVSGVLLAGCVAHSADDLYRRKQEEAKKRLPVPPTIEDTKPITPPTEVRKPPTPPIEPKETVSVDDASPAQFDNPSSSYDVNLHSRQQGKTLFNGKAFCSKCHGYDGDIKNVSDADVAKLNPRPTDLRKPTDKSVRQLYLILKYGIPATGMISMQEAIRLSERDVLNIISYLAELRGSPLSFDAISTQRYLPHTETDMEIERMCEEEAIGDSDLKDYCEDRYSKRYRDLLIGRPPDIPTDQYAGIEKRCKQQSGKDLDKLALCYRAEYSSIR